MIFGQRIPETPTMHHGRFESYCSSKIVLLWSYWFLKINISLNDPFSLGMVDCSGLKISVKVQSLSFQAGIVGQLSITMFEGFVIMFLFYFQSFYCFLVSDLDNSLFLTEPFYGTMCIYNRERREKLSEDFYFSVLPSEMQDVSKNAIYALYFYQLMI